MPLGLRQFLPQFASLCVLRAFHLLDCADQYANIPVFYLELSLKFAMSPLQLHYMLFLLHQRPPLLLLLFPNPRHLTPNILQHLILLPQLTTLRLHLLLQLSDVLFCAFVLIFHVF